MSAEFQSIDDQIKASYQSASQIETQARQLEDRISRIDGAKRHLPARRYGQPVDTAKIRSNSTQIKKEKLADITHPDARFIIESEEVHKTIASVHRPAASRWCQSETTTRRLFLAANTQLQKLDHPFSSLSGEEGFPTVSRAGKHN